MPYCYCHSESCDHFDLPQWVPPDAPEVEIKGDACSKKCDEKCARLPSCGTCGERRHLGPKVPLPVQRFRSAAKDSQKPLPELPVTTTAGKQGKTSFYCQNP